MWIVNEEIESMFGAPSDPTTIWLRLSDMRKSPLFTSGNISRYMKMHNMIQVRLILDFAIDTSNFRSDYC